jgi:cyclopropane fatty-acyl-phospholipid synthase-like methyltransferase
MSNSVPLVMEGGYQAMFNVRGHSYDQAMQYCPAARQREFSQLFQGVDVSRLNRVLDIPSGGGYLKPYLAANCQLDSMDPCEHFKAISGGRDIDLNQMALRTDHYDAVICLAALHHITNKQAFINALLAALHSDGCLLLADVAAGSGEAAFLDEFAGHYNQTGHQGDYLSAQRRPDYLQSSSSKQLLAYEMRDCHWRFADQQQMLHFCRLLFSLVQSSDKELMAALERHVGVGKVGGVWSLQWQLLYVHIGKPMSL